MSDRPQVSGEEGDQSFWGLIGQAGTTPPDDTETRKKLLDKAEAELKKAEEKG
ncbi:MULTISPECIES: hypothetical protein [Streptomyces]|uniref:hypothetical protein n=1 Tax=Streptomyces TaxID=1883 RepID=UPI0013F3A6E4|nr:MULTISPECIES: hypothetical protein [Streptomyces]MBT3077609.1 hypothetical protein [Streptomyces sp. COG21]MBT3084455.1 hypothetical protein [Streptomyces sp. COG20]MBT3085362.1 hypothetical protein [Streptomyces sp. CYG21]MBT3095918.1 hypothetical protein [Streptomyces sp. CBG30]MBT3103595.1 hypothetical protein [Streptomyces sp. COG19]